MKSPIHTVARRYVTRLFHRAEVKINGTDPWDIQVSNPDFYDRVLLGGSLALGETYMKGWWECRSLDQFFFRILKAGIDRSAVKKLPELTRRLAARLVNRQGRRRAFVVGEHHYDVGNDLFEVMLDPYMTYSCGYWHGVESLAEAQAAKLELICRKLMLQPGMRLLDIGCGWGSLALYAARHYGVEVVGLTISEKQAQCARERCSGLPVDIRLQDYRAITERFDAIASVGMFEHVGYKNYPTFMQVTRRCLREGGLFLLHTIGANTTGYFCDPWFDKYIFPNGMLPSIKQVGEAIEPCFVMEDWHNLGVDYERTVLSWYHNFEKNWDMIKERYGEQFFRMWRYYLLSLAGGFRARHMQVWQIVLSRGDINRYRSTRWPVGAV